MSNRLIERDIETDRYEERDTDRQKECEGEWEGSDPTRRYIGSYYKPQPRVRSNTEPWFSAHTPEVRTRAMT